MSIADNITNVRARIAQAAQRAGRAPDDVQLLVVTKNHTVDEIRKVHEAGYRLVGENRVQEAQQKIPQLPGDFIWHMIGHIQTNKAKVVPRLFRMAHSVDSVRLARELNKAQLRRQEESAFRGQTAGEPEQRFGILLEVNVSGEESKFGLPPAAVEAVLREIAAMEALRVRGLMTMAPYVDDPERARPFFRALRELRERLRDLALENAPLDRLSMGMSNDYEVAIEEGATIVRVGSAIFGSGEGR